MARLNADQLRRLARLGATSRLEQIRTEEAAIRAEFPELFGRAASRGRGATAAAASAAKGGHRRRPAMSAVQRRAVSERMRKYWADRRTAKGAK